ncbi:hypothetical protein MMC34_005640 [Xylographa carneopallida]|nr:hypothetical protein [Xylographa carneopallida]
MAEFIGSRISLISKRDIRYVGTLHEISSENSTVALEQVVSFGTEGRRSDDEVPASDNVYEYIVFRGSDVKDLRIEEGPKESKPPKPPVPDDPAILGSARRPPSAAVSQTHQAPQAVPGLAQSAPLEQQSQNQQQQQPQQRPQQSMHPQFSQQPPYPYQYPPPNQRFGPQAFPPGPGFPGMPYGAPPGWYPPSGYGYPHMPPGQFHPQQMPIGPPGHQIRQPAPPIAPTAPKAPTPTASSVNEDPKGGADVTSEPKPTVKLPISSGTPAPLPVMENAPPPPIESKPDIAAALAPPSNVATRRDLSASNSFPTGPKSGRIVPIVPLPSPNIKPHVAANGALKAASGNTLPTAPVHVQAPVSSTATTVKPKTIEEANRDARAAVAAAMAKLPPAPGPRKAPPADNVGAMDNLTKKVNEMRTNDNIRTSRQPGTGGYAAGHRGGERGSHRGGRRQSEQQGRKLDLPTADYDFELANAKFNKQDLVKEAIATGDPVGTPVEGSTTNGVHELEGTNGDRKGSESSVSAAGVAYNKSSSFFDNISSESKDRTQEGGNRLGGREFRSEERQKNLETFGQGSVDNGYRGGRGGRGRGRGYGRVRGGRGGYEPRGAPRTGARAGRGAITSEG